ncbi:MAG: hypothetical protein ABI333_20740 [bacterium]
MGHLEATTGDGIELRKVPKPVRLQELGVHGIRMNQGEIGWFAPTENLVQIEALVRD